MGLNDAESKVRRLKCQMLNQKTGKQESGPGKEWLIEWMHDQREKRKRRPAGFRLPIR